MAGAVLPTSLVLRSGMSLSTPSYTHASAHGDAYAARHWAIRSTGLGLVGMLRATGTWMPAVSGSEVLKGRGQG